MINWATAFYVSGTIFFLLSSLVILGAHLSGVLN